jgi:hypothetical protein
MAQEFKINSTAIEDKINQLLPSQGGFGAGIDFSASTMVMPIIDLTETAEGSGLREDLQKSLTHGNVTDFSINAATATIVNTTGYWRVFGTSYLVTSGSATRTATIRIDDGTTTKNVFQNLQIATVNNLMSQISYDFIVKLEAGDTLEGSCTPNSGLNGVVRQIASLDGTLINP